HAGPPGLLEQPDGARLAGAVQVERVAVDPVHHGHHDRGAVLHEAHRGDLPGGQDPGDRRPVVAGLVPELADRVGGRKRVAVTHETAPIRARDRDGAYMLYVIPSRLQDVVASRRTRRARTLGSRT